MARMPLNEWQVREVARHETLEYSDPLRQSTRAQSSPDHLIIIVRFIELTVEHTFNKLYSKNEFNSHCACARVHKTTTAGKGANKTTTSGKGDKTTTSGKGADKTTTSGKGDKTATSDHGIYSWLM